MALSMKPWGSISEADYANAAAYCAACLVDMNPAGAEKKKELCKLPVREPDGMVNRNGMLAAAGALMGARGGVDLPGAEKRVAAKKLANMMNRNGMQPSDKLMSMAGIM